MKIFAYQWYSYSAQIVRSNAATVNENAFHLVLRCGSEVKQNFGIHHLEGDDLIFCSQENVEVSFKFSKAFLEVDVKAQLSLNSMEG